MFLEEEKGRLYVDIDARGLLRADTASRTNYYRQMYNIGAMSPNEIRAAEDLDAYEGGDTFFRPLNMQEANFIEQFIKQWTKIKTRQSTGR